MSVDFYNDISCFILSVMPWKTLFKLQATIHVQLETRANTDASWVDIGVDVPPDLLRIFITISVLVSDITLSRDIRAYNFFILRYVLKPVQVTPVITCTITRQSQESKSVEKLVNIMLAPLHARTWTFLSQQNLHRGLVCAQWYYSQLFVSLCRYKWMSQQPDLRTCSVQEYLRSVLLYVSKWLCAESRWSIMSR